MYSGRVARPDKGHKRQGSAPRRRANGVRNTPWSLDPHQRVREDLSQEQDIHRSMPWVACPTVVRSSAPEDRYIYIYAYRLPVDLRSTDEYFASKPYRLGDRRTISDISSDYASSVHCFADARLVLLVSGRDVRIRQQSVRGESYPIRWPISIEEGVCELTLDALHGVR